MCLQDIFKRSRDAQVHLAAGAGGAYLLELCGYEGDEAVADAAAAALLALTAPCVLADVLRAEGGLGCLLDMLESDSDSARHAAFVMLSRTCLFCKVWSPSDPVYRYCNVECSARVLSFLLLSCCAVQTLAAHALVAMLGHIVVQIKGTTCLCFRPHQARE